MDYPTLILLFSFLLTFVYVVTISGRHNSRLPPGPYPFPIIGNLLQLGDKPHHSLTTLSKRYGPLMSLKLGTKTTIIVSSPDIAKEFFHTHDLSCSSRSVPDAARTLDHDNYSVGWLPVGDQWRKLRKITKEYMFSVQCLDASALLREKKVQELVDHVNSCCVSEKAVNIGGVVFTTILNNEVLSRFISSGPKLTNQDATLNILSNFIFSMDFAQYESVSSQEFKDTIKALTQVAGKPNLVDFFPILKPFDPQGLHHQGNVHTKKLMNIFDRIIDQRLQTNSSSSASYDSVSSTNNDVLDSLLILHHKNESEFSRNDMRHLFYDLFTAGTDTTSSTLEWALAELIRNPQKMEMARSEVIKLLQNKNRNLQEHDISELPYLQALIKETLRLHPPAPLLLPHQAIHDLEIQGFIVPKNAQILCNVWAMGRDVNIWSDPEMFMPERFLDVNIGYKGQDFELIPFGAGRRICPGLSISHRMLHIILGSLIQKFDWKLEGNIKAQDLDMGENFGITLHRSVPLMAIPTRY